MEYTIYMLDLDNKQKILSGNLVMHTHMNIWLKQNGDKNYIYELQKNTKVYSRWIFKEKDERMATPKKYPQ